MREASTVAVVVAIGAAVAWVWIRLGLYGFGLPVGLVALTPLLALGVVYWRAGRVAHLGVLLIAFAGTWLVFETWTWLNAASDPAVSIPGWTPIPLATSVGLLLIGAAVTVAGSRTPD
ncbi:MAG TPA: hypothetical protein VF364_02270 [Candidatus Limnocylindria bacterium]